MLRLLTHFCARIEPGRLARMIACLTCLPLPMWRDRARGHEEARRRLLAESAGAQRTGWSDIDSGRAAVRSHARFVGEFLAELGGRRHRVDGELPASASGRGRLYVTLHTGNWIVGARFLSEHAGTVHSVAGVQLRAAWRHSLEARLGALGIRVHGGRGVAPALLSALRAGETVALHLDGDPGIEVASGAAPGGRPRIQGIRAAALLAARSRAEVWFALCRRNDAGHFRFEARALVPPGARPAAWRDWQDTFRRLTCEEVERHPDDWLIFRPAMGTSEGSS